MTSLEQKCYSNISLNSKNHHPQHSHGDGDLLHRVCYVGDNSVVPVILLLIMVVDDDVVDVDAVVSFESIRALKLTLFESFRVLTFYDPI